MSVLTHLQRTASNAVLSGSEKDSISKSISTLEGRIDVYFEKSIVQQFRFGSSTRDTILPRKMDEHSDIDYMVVLDDDGSKPQTYLNRMAKFAEKCYATSEISQSSPAIVLELNHIKFDLVPAIKTFYGYQIPNGPSAWRDTNPNDFNQQLINKNGAHASLIKPTIRLAKYWNALNGYPFESFGFEKWILGLSFLFCTNQKDYFFYVLTSLGNNYNTTTQQKVDRAVKIINQVKAYEDEGLTAKAEAEIKKLIP